jgi:hypothetical protein
MDRQCQFNLLYLYMKWFHCCIASENWVCIANVDTQITIPNLKTGKTNQENIIQGIINTIHLKNVGPNIENHEDFLS